jgi:mRNA interferase HigB
MMIILIKKTLLVFSEKHPLATLALDKWYDIAKAADWSKLSDIKKVFNSVDYVGNDRYVFNIKGNDFRLVAMIFFDKRTLYIRFIGTHSEYDKINCSTI